MNLLYDKILRFKIDVDDVDRVISFSKHVVDVLEGKELELDGYGDEVAIHRNRISDRGVTNSLFAIALSYSLSTFMEKLHGVANGGWISICDLKSLAVKCYCGRGLTWR